MTKRKVTAEELLARAESDGYKMRAYREDNTRDERDIDKIKEDQNTALDRYVLWGISIPRLAQILVLTRSTPGRYSPETQKHSLQ